MIVTFIPAAGASSRMRGKDKLLEDVDGMPTLRRTAVEALAAGLGPVVVGIRYRDNKRRKALRGLDVHMVEVADAESGMSATIREGAKTAVRMIGDAYPSGGDHEYFGMMVLLPDMPGITRNDIQAMDLAFQGSGGAIVRATTPAGAAGHPVIFPDWLIGGFEALEGDKGALKLLEGERVVTIPLPGDRAVRDLDTPEDWAAWRSRR